MSWTLILILILVSIPGILVTTPGLVRKMLPVLAEKLPQGQSLPPASVLRTILYLEVLVLVAGFAILGGYAAPEVGLQAPFFSALVNRGEIWPSMSFQLLPMLVGGLLGGLVLVACYYLIFRPRLDEKTVSSMEGLRLQLGLAGRLLYGGILEEVLTRWGMMSATAWIGLKLTGEASPSVMWAAIVISGIIFGLLHIPNYVLTGSRLSPLFASLMLFLNLWASLVFGWLFWQYGLLAAIGAHMLFHLVWYPFDKAHASKTSQLKTISGSRLTA
ncbi:MAG TPA: hypothetical protein DCY42_04790 [Chloroflexi bacterium]|nr:hypothetical protein [Chloroflexota bacterium]